jgi:hypothetical protein
MVACTVFLGERGWGIYFTAPSVTCYSVIWWSEFLATDPEVRVRFPALPHFLKSSGTGTRGTQPHEYN